MADQASIAFVARLEALFGEPATRDPLATIAEYTNAVAGRPHAILQDAADRLRDNHKIRCWPTVAECLEQIREAEKFAAIHAAPRRPSVGKQTEHVLCPRDVQWADWIKHMLAKGHRDLAEQAADVGEIVVVGSRWPQPGCALPRIFDRAATLRGR